MEHRRPLERGIKWLATPLSSILISAWVAWWVASVRCNHWVLSELTWVPRLPIVAGDFRVHLDHVARVAASGTNPYLKSDDLACAVYPYPPLVTRLFGWVNLLSPAVAVWVWLGALAVMFGIGTFAVLRSRARLALAPIPAAVAVVSVLFSTPALMAMERGQCDPLVIPALAVTAWLLTRPWTWAELAAGALLGVTGWIKYYPAVAVLALVALRRWQALTAFVLVAAAIGCIDRVNVQRAIDHGAIAARLFADKVPYCHPTKHAVAECWPGLWAGTRWHRLGRAPGMLVAVVLLVPAVISVTRRVGRAAEPGALAFPLMLWLSAAATYAMAWSNDYNLVSLPLAALAVWDRRDVPTVQLAMALLLIWWQPLALPIGGKALFLIKLAGLYAVGASLAARARPAEPGFRGVEMRRPLLNISTPESE